MRTNSRNCFKDNSKFCNACELATDISVFQFLDDLISILPLKKKLKLMKNKEFKIKLVSLLEGDKKEINHELAVHFCHFCQGFCQGRGSPHVAATF